MSEHETPHHRRANWLRRGVVSMAKRAKRLQEGYNWNAYQIAVHFGVSESVASNLLRLSKLPEDERAIIGSAEQLYLMTVNTDLPVMGCPPRVIMSMLSLNPADRLELLNYSVRTSWVSLEMVNNKRKNANI